LGEQFTIVKRLTAELDRRPEHAGTLLDIAQESSLDHMLVTRGVIHFTNAGDPEKMHLVHPMLLDLELIEWWRQSSQNIHGIPGSLTACLASWWGKDGLTSMEKDLHDFRAMLAFELLGELGDIRGIRLVAPLIAALKEPVSAGHAESLLAHISERPLGEGNANIMKKLIRVCCAAMRDEKAVKWMRDILPKIISEGQNDVIHWIAPLIKSAADPVAHRTAVFLLDRLEHAPRYGLADGRAISQLESALNCAYDDPSRQWWATIFPKKLYRKEGLNLRIKGVKRYQGPKFGGSWRSRVRLRERAEVERMRKKPKLRLASGF